MNLRLQFLTKLLAVFISLACLYPCTAWGQASNSAELTGTVTDASGAVIPGARVTVTDIDKSVVRAFTTNGSGVYDTGPLVPQDHYTIEFQKEGFAAVVRGPMTLGVGITGL